MHFLTQGATGPRVAINGGDAPKEIETRLKESPPLHRKNAVKLKKTKIGGVPQGRSEKRKDYGSLYLKDLKYEASVSVRVGRMA